DDARGLARLGSAYYQLLAGTRERVWADRILWAEQQKTVMAGSPRPLYQLRHVQAAAALNQALLLQEDLEAVHRQLGDLYARLGFPDQQGNVRRGYLDVVLQHRKAELRYARLGPRAGEEPELYH